MMIFRVWATFCYPTFDIKKVLNLFENLKDVSAWPTETSRLKIGELQKICKFEMIKVTNLFKPVNGSNIISKILPLEMFLDTSSFLPLSLLTSVSING